MLRDYATLECSALNGMSLSNPSSQSSGSMWKRGQKDRKREVVDDVKETVFQTQQGRCTYSETVTPHKTYTNASQLEEGRWA